jgi:hypothetical protein
LPKYSAACQHGPGLLRLGRPVQKGVSTPCAGLSLSIGTVTCHMAHVKSDITLIEILDIDCWAVGSRAPMTRCFFGIGPPLSAAPTRTAAPTSDPCGTPAGPAARTRSCADRSGPGSRSRPTTEPLSGDLHRRGQRGSNLGHDTAFKITLNGTLTTLYNFCSQTDCSDGRRPFAARPGYQRRLLRNNQRWCHPLARPLAAEPSSAFPTG